MQCLHGCHNSTIEHVAVYTTYIHYGSHLTAISIIKMLTKTIWFSQSVYSNIIIIWSECVRVFLRFHKKKNSLDILDRVSRVFIYFVCMMCVPVHVKWVRWCLCFHVWIWIGFIVNESFVLMVRIWWSCGVKVNFHHGKIIIFCYFLLFLNAIWISF